MNCLQKPLAMSLPLVRILWPKAIGWLGGEYCLFPERFLIILQNFDGSDLWSADSTLSLQILHLFSMMRLDICWFRRSMCGLWGSVDLSSSLSFIRSAISRVNPGIKLQRKPARIACFDADRSTS